MSTVISNGLVIGAIYGLVALGLTLVYKKSRVLNFAHGEVGMVGAFVFYVALVEQRLPYLVAAFIGVVVAAGLGCVTFLLLLRRRNDPLNMLIGTLAVAGTLTFAANEVWGPDQHFVPPPLTGVSVNVVGLHFVGPRLLVLLAAIILAAVFFVLFRTTHVALLFRASAADPYAASLMGINVTRLDVATWTVAGALAGMAAILVAPLVGFDIFFMTLLGIRGFAAALLAGLVNVPAALGAGLALGLAEAALTRQTTQPGLPEAVLVVLVVMFLLRPQATVRRTA
ncbi:MAG TPA: branched-chain amino acid ABC transporter permease [Acidimicrobiia bacterium]|nr:branched-chain amino acid ABC transporter permease [Acidimicrobiia bacterium]